LNVHRVYRATFLSVSALVENEDGTWGWRKVTLEEYLRATPKEREEMGWWYGGLENLEAEMEEAIKRADWHSYAWVQRHSKKCPHCQIPIQREYGCNKMTCSMCKTSFCWNCDKILDKQNPYGHFQAGVRSAHVF
ncbi:hypothetical protein COOONC_18489, partial [Cooperia oncophora]